MDEDVESNTAGMTLIFLLPFLSESSVIGSLQLRSQSSLFVESIIEGYKWENARQSAKRCQLFGWLVSEQYSDFRALLVCQELLQTGFIFCAVTFFERLEYTGAVSANAVREVPQFSSGVLCYVVGGLIGRIERYLMCM